jgi:hypothetical protein
LKIFHAYCKSLENNYNELNLILLHEKYIFTGTETSFDSNIPLGRINNNNYNVFRRDRNGGGIITAIDKKYKCMRRVDLEFNILEIM